jgi:hypothetical protein
MHTLTVKYKVNVIRVYCLVSEATRTERSCLTVRHGRHDRGADNDNIVRTYVVHTHHERKMHVLLGFAEIRAPVLSLARACCSHSLLWMWFGIQLTVNAKLYF